MMQPDLLNLSEIEAEFYRGRGSRPDILKAIAELRALRTALLRYGGHFADVRGDEEGYVCEKLATGNGRCSCGWDSLKAQLETAQ